MEENNLHNDSGAMQDQTHSLEDQSHNESTDQQLANAENDNIAAQQIQSDRERNFSALREARERAERERDEALRYIQQMQMQSNSQQPMLDDDRDLAPDDLVEWRHVEKKIKNIETKLRNYENYTQSNVADARIKAQFSDFDQVVTHENVDLLRTLHPEIAQSLHSTPDLYNKAVSTYNIIKKFGIYKNNSHEYEKSLAQKNSSKPRATNTVSPQQGDTPLSKANDFANGFLTDDRKAQLYKEMMEARNNY